MCPHTYEHIDTFTHRAHTLLLKHLSSNKSKINVSSFSDANKQHGKRTGVEGQALKNLSEAGLWWCTQPALQSELHKEEPCLNLPPPTHTQKSLSHHFVHSLSSAVSSSSTLPNFGGGAGDWTQGLAHASTLYQWATLCSLSKPRGTENKSGLRVRMTCGSKEMGGNAEIIKCFYIIAKMVTT